MMPLEISRKYVFWLLDFLKGRKIRKHYCDITFVLTRSSSKEALERQDKRLTAILRHAAATTQFYKEKRDCISLKDFPVVNKSVVRESFNSFISDKFRESELVPVVTSGSTGTPFKVYHDKNKRLRNSADTIFFIKMAGYDIGERLIYMKVWVEQNKKTSLGYWMENMIPVDVSRLNDMQIKGLLHQMEDHKSTYNILGYASALESVCKYLDKTNHSRVKADVGSIIATSETLSGYTKETMRKYFNAPVISRYSNLENGIIAQQETAGSEKYLINTASYVVEILKMGFDEQAEPGETGRIVITDLFNYGMPLIRYDTGDIGVLSSDSKIGGNMYLDKVEGRKIDALYDTKGNFVSGYRLNIYMWQYSEIIQYQIIQDGPKKYTVRLNVAGNFIWEAKLIKEFKEALGEDANITIDYVFEIPLLSSGKRKIAVNNYLHVS
jgi:phenylacetate-CoA ligase